ncbi:MAG TPA: alpha/beta hydrolase-fold protein [Pyrinomonadaceae bacterium]|jgi:hypothetical protein
MSRKFFSSVFAPILFAVALILSNASDSAGQTRASQSSGALRFEVKLARGLTVAAQTKGRLFVVLSRRREPEPRTTVGETGMDAPVVLARDLERLAPDAVGLLDASAAIFPLETLSQLPAGEYFVQALFDSNVDLKSVNAPGNLYSDVQSVRLDASRGATVRLELARRVLPEELPAETEYVKYVRLQSKLLSAFHKRPIYLRAGIILPRGHASDRGARYPLRIHIGGYGARFDGVERMMRAGSEFRRAWEATDAPRMILLHLDGDGPFGDPYQVNSDNNGPYGDAITQELIPHVEEKFRAVGEPYARVLDGGSTGGWVSLALQIFYPDFFGGAWSFCPDSPDFRAFQLIDIYADRNAYRNEHGFERPSARDRDGDTRFTIRHECQMENVKGLGDSWTMSGEQWGAWNAVYGERDAATGRPRPLWNPQTGEIDRAAVEHWKRYDLRLVLENNWPKLAPKLRGKLRIWMGDADSYFLNNGLYLLDDFLSKARPAYEGRITYGRREGHCWIPLKERELLDEMTAAIESARPQR